MNTGKLTRQPTLEEDSEQEHCGWRGKVDQTRLTFRKPDLRGAEKELMRSWKQERNPRQKPVIYSSWTILKKKESINVENSAWILTNVMKERNYLISSENPEIVLMRQLLIRKINLFEKGSDTLTLFWCVEMSIIKEEIKLSRYIWASHFCTALACFRCGISLCCLKSSVQVDLSIAGRCLGSKNKSDSAWPRILQALPLLSFCLGISLCSLILLLLK